MDWVTATLRAVVLRAEMTGSPRFLGNPIAHVPWSPTPVVPRRSALPRSGAAFRRLKNVGSHDLRFRGSIHGPCSRCLRFAWTVVPAPTQDSLPAACQLCRAGFRPAGFQLWFQFYMTSSIARLPGALSRRVGRRRVSTAAPERRRKRKFAATAAKWPSAHEARTCRSTFARRGVQGDRLLGA